jgi:AbrB family looped-hinge helix DNA binding protein
MDSTKASSKGQMVIPKPIRDALEIKPGTKLDVELVPGKGFTVTVRASDRKAAVQNLAGSLARYAKRPGSARADDVAIMQMVAEDDARIRSYAKPKSRKRR